MFLIVRVYTNSKHTHIHTHTHLWPSIFCFSAGNRWRSFGYEFPCYKDGRWRFFVTKLYAKQLTFWL